MPIDLKNQVISGIQILTQIFIISQKKKSGNQKIRNNFHWSSSFLARPYIDIQNDVNFGGMRAEQKNAIIVKTKTILVQTNAIIVKKKEIIVQKICNYCANKTIFIAQKIQLVWVKKKQLFRKKMDLLREKNNCCAKKKQLLWNKYVFDETTRMFKLHFKLSFYRHIFLMYLFNFTNITFFMIHIVLFITSSCWGTKKCTKT